MIEIEVLTDRVRTQLNELRANYRVFRNLPRMLPFARVNPASLMDQWAEVTPHALALLFDDERYSWREFAQRATRYASFFHVQGIRAGDVVALVMDNRPDFLFALLGLNKIGAVGALINHNLTGAPLTHAINVARPRKVLTGAEHLSSVLEVIDSLEDIARDRDLWVQTQPGDDHPDGVRIINDEVANAPRWQSSWTHRPRNSETYCFIYTSGTTGLPKAAIVTNQRQIVAGTAFGEVMIESGAGEITYVPLPLYHSSAMYIGFGAALAKGGAIALAKKFSASRYWEDVRRYDCTAILYIGELCRYLLHQPVHPDERKHRVRVGVGNGLRPDIWEEFTRRFGVPQMREFYGATEGNAPTLNFEGRPGMVGRLRRGQVVVKCDPITGDIIRNADGFCDEIRPGETGLLLGKINRVTKFDGYVDQSSTSKKIVENVFKPGDRYFNTGDLLCLHDNKWLSFADRLGDTFRWKGENVSTNEVAELLNGAPGVLEANVYGVKVPRADGRAGMAALNVNGQFDIAALAGYVVEKFPKYQRPFFIRVLSSDMRKTSTLKHQKVDYREEGFDPGKVDDPLYFLDGDQYVPIDAKLYARFEAGDIAM